MLLFGLGGLLRVHNRKFLSESVSEITLEIWFHKNRSSLVFGAYCCYSLSVWLTKRTALPFKFSIIVFNLNSFVVCFLYLCSQTLSSFSHLFQ